MRKIGLVGGMSWQSTILYYKYINEYVEKRLGGLNSAEIIISSINFSKLEKLQRSKKWEDAERLILNEIRQLIKCGAGLIGVCSNTGNECVERIQKKIKVPLIHIAVPIGEYLATNNLKRVGLIGTAHTMKEGYIKEVLIKKFGIEIFIPKKGDQNYINRVIYEELCKGIINKTSKIRYLSIMDKLIKSHNLQGFILGCTEIPLLLNQNNVRVNLIDSTKIHAEYLAKKSLQN